jgi:NAD(P)-dependent dehydrogenase (short-subunit alcohol dehydrogenase family)
LSDPPILLVTGANRGLGIEFVRQYAADGWHVVATCRNPDAAAELAAVGGDVDVHRLDVTSEGDLDRLVADLDGQPIDLLISNAAVLGGPKSRLDNVDLQAWRDAFEVNVLGAVRVVLALRPNVLAGTHRKVVVMGSRAGLPRGAKAGGTYIYRSTKAALHTAARMLALDLADEGVTVVILNPGHVRTGIGGKNAPTGPSESVAAMRKVIADLRPEQAGTFLQPDGSELAL